MATQIDDISGSGYGNAYIDSLIWGCKWSAAPVTYWFGSGAEGEFTGAAWSDGEKDAFQMALENYEAICGLTFSEAADQNSANIVWWLAPDAWLDALGMHEVPNGDSPQVYGYFGYEDPSWDYLAQGQYGYITIIHELGHGMGLAHPHDGGDESDATVFPGVKGAFNSYGTNSLNQGIWTTMSYNDGWDQARSNTDAYGWQGTLMAFDIAALQTLYGANNTYHTGDDVYELPGTNGVGTFWSCIWDAGGSDTISADGLATAVTINLQAAPLSGANGGGYISRASGIMGGFTIANNVTIENATGGSGNDTLVGNAAANILDGGLGNDTMSGGLGNDTYIVNSGLDKITELTGQGVDTVEATSSYVLGSNLENLTLLSGALNGTGNLLANTLNGNDGNNILNGMAGADVMIGGHGDDTYVVDSLLDTVTELADEGTDTINTTITFTLADNIENLVLIGSGAINGTGNDDNNAITGNAKNNILSGLDGNDTFTPANGTDIVIGGEGNDIINLTESSSSRDSLRYAEDGAGNVDTVSEFRLRTDLVQFSVGDIGGDQLATLSGADLTIALAARAMSDITLAVNSPLVFSSTLAGKNLLFLSNIAGNTFDDAIGTGSIGISADASLGAGKAIAATFYDNATQQAVIGLIENSDTGTANVINADDTFVEIVRIGMLSSAYNLANIDGSLGTWLG